MTPQILVINLDRDTQRLEPMRARLGGLGLPFVRLPAVLGANLTPTQLATSRPDPRYWLERRDFTKSEIGCALSHRAAWSFFLESNAPFALVLEDDVAFAADFAGVVAGLEPLMRRFDLIKLEGLAGGAEQFWTRRLGALGARELILPRYPGVSAAGYALSRTAAERLLRRTSKIEEPVDHAVTDYARLLLRYAELHPFPIVQEFHQSQQEAGRKGAPQAKPDMQYRLRKKAHKMLRRWRQRLYEFDVLGPATLWTPQDRHDRAAYLQKIGVVGAARAAAA